MIFLYIIYFLFFILYIMYLYILFLLILIFFYITYYICYINYSYIYIYDLYCLKAICYDLTWTSMDGNNPALRSHVSHFQGQQLWTAPVDPEPAEKSLILQNFFLSLGQGFKSHPQCLEISAKDLVSLTTLTFDIL